MANFPVPDATPERPSFDPPTMFYAVVFHVQWDNYRPVAAFNTKEECEKYLKTVEAWFKDNNFTYAAACVGMTWEDFLGFARGQNG